MNRDTVMAIVLVVLAALFTGIILAVEAEDNTRAARCNVACAPDPGFYMNDGCFCPTADGYGLAPVQCRGAR